MVICSSLYKTKLGAVLFGRDLWGNVRRLLIFHVGRCWVSKFEGVTMARKFLDMYIASWQYICISLVGDIFTWRGVHKPIV
jgi:hypothetical protein